VELFEHRGGDHWGEYGSGDGRNDGPGKHRGIVKRVTSNSFALTVAPGVLTSISITGPSSVVAGSTAQFLATDNYSDNSSGNVKPVSGLSR
jgi:hypothetical protein